MRIRWSHTLLITALLSLSALFAAPSAAHAADPLAAGDAAATPADGVLTVAAADWQDRLTEFLEGDAVQIGKQVLFGLLLFLAGWLVSKFLAWTIFRLLCRTSVDDQLAERLGIQMLLDGKSDTPNRIERFIARVVYYVLMLLVVVGVLQFAGLTQAAEPIGEFVSRITAALPLVGKALLILVIAYFGGTILQRLVSGGLNKLQIDSRFAELSAPADTPDADADADTQAKAKAKADEDARPFSETTGRVVFWLIMLAGLAGAVDALEIGPLAYSLQNALDRIVAFLPALAIASVLIIAGYILGRIARAVLDNALDAVGLNRLVARAGLEKLFGAPRASGVVGIAAMVFILLQAIIAALGELELVTLSEPLTDMMAEFWQFLPVLAVSVVIVAAGFIGGRLLRGVVERALDSMGFDEMMAKIGFGELEEEEGRLSHPHQIIGLIVQIGVVLVAVVQALDNLELHTWAAYVDDFIQYSISHAAVAVIIIAVGLAIGNYVRDVILMRRQGEDDETVGWIAAFARYAVLVFAFTMAIHHLDIGPGFVLVAFSLLFGGLCLAGALAFGLGSREVAGEIVRRQYTKAQRQLRARADADADVPGTAVSTAVKPSDD